MPAPAASDLDLDLDLERLDTAIEAAIRAGGPGTLRVLGFGEMTLVIAWPPECPTLAVKRLPLFPDPLRLSAYGALLDEYVAELERRGVRVLPTALRTVAAPGGVSHAYLVQPLMPRQRVLSVALGRVNRAEGARLLAELAEAVVSAVDERLGLDAQAGNWVLDDGSLACVDVSTPLLRDAGGRERLDLAPFLSAYPWSLRPWLCRVARGVMAQYHDPRTVLVDAASNLLKEQLGGRLGALLEAANRRVEPPIERREVVRYLRSDGRLWLLMQGLRRADRAWQRRVRHRPYPFLLPPPYRYGPMTPPGGDVP